MAACVAIALACLALGAPAGGRPRIEWRDSVAVGAPTAAPRARRPLPAQGRAYFTWDPVLKRQPNSDWRRWGTDDLVRTTLGVLREFQRRHPHAPRVGVGDLGLRQGGYFGPEVGGGIGHATHQNGLDVDVYYPRRDHAEEPPVSVDQVNVRRAQELVDLFVAAGAVTIYVGPNLPLTGPPGVVTPLVNHDNHLHVENRRSSGEHDLRRRPKLEPERVWQAKVPGYTRIRTDHARLEPLVQVLDRGPLHDHGIADLGALDLDVATDR